MVNMVVYYKGFRIGKGSNVILYGVRISRDRIVVVYASTSDRMVQYYRTIQGGAIWAILLVNGPDGPSMLTARCCPISYWSLTCYRGLGLINLRADIKYRVETSKSNQSLYVDRQK